MLLPKPLLDHAIYKQQDKGMAVGRCLGYCLVAIQSFLSGEFAADGEEVYQKVDGLYRSMVSVPKGADLSRMASQLGLVVEPSNLPNSLENGSAVLLKLAWNLEKLASYLGEDRHLLPFDQIAADEHTREDARHFIWIFSILGDSYLCWDSFFGGHGRSPVWITSGDQIIRRHKLLEELGFSDDAPFMGRYYLIRRSE